MIEALEVSWLQSAAAQCPVQMNFAQMNFAQMNFAQMDFVLASA